MEVKLSNKFKKFAKEKNIVAVTIKYGKSCSSWSGSFKVPEVLKEKPKDLRNYKYHSVDGIEIYVHKTVKATKENCLELKIVGFLMLKEIDVKGMDFTI
jgi:hypothetical protein